MRSTTLKAFKASSRIIGFILQEEPIPTLNRCFVKRRAV